MAGKMDSTDLEEIMKTIRTQAVVLQRAHAADELAKYERWKEEKPLTKTTIESLVQSRNILRKEVIRLEAVVNNTQSNAQLKPAGSGAHLGFNVIQSKKSAAGEVSIRELQEEKERMEGALNRIDEQITEIRRELTLKSQQATELPAGQESLPGNQPFPWETNLVILQVSPEFVQSTT